jgi:hypothetical protein
MTSKDHPACELAYLNALAKMSIYEKVPLTAPTEPLLPAQASPSLTWLVPFTAATFVDAVKRDKQLDKRVLKMAGL